MVAEDVQVLLIKFMFALIEVAVHIAVRIYFYRIHYSHFCMLCLSIHYGFGNRSVNGKVG